MSTHDGRDVDATPPEPEPEPDELDPTDNSSGAAVDDRRVAEVEEETHRRSSS